MKGQVPANLKESDLRVQQTCKSLRNAMVELLEHRNFNSITVHDLCLEARVSRASFYSHFHDKYDLLGCLLVEIRVSVIRDVDQYEELEREVNHFVDSNKKMIINVLKDANRETLTLVMGFMSSIMELITKRPVYDEADPHYLILSHFLVGGLLNLLTWIIDNNFPPEVPMVNTYLYKMLETITAWDAQQEQIDIL